MAVRTIRPTVPTPSSMGTIYFQFMQTRYAQYQNAFDAARRVGNFARIEEIKWALKSELQGVPEEIVDTIWKRIGEVAVFNASDPNYKPLLPGTVLNPGLSAVEEQQAGNQDHANQTVYWASGFEGVILQDEYNIAKSGNTAMQLELIARYQVQGKETKVAQLKAVFGMTDLVDSGTQLDAAKLLPLMGAALFVGAT